MAIIRITDLKLRAIIGTNAWERKVRQTILINIRIDFAAQKAILSDRLSDTVDYKTITKAIIKEVRKSRFYLLEKLTAHVLNLVLSFKNVKKAKVRIDKPKALRYSKSVSVELSKDR